MSIAVIGYIYVARRPSVNSRPGAALRIVMFRGLGGGLVARYEPGAAMKCDVIPKPANRHLQTVPDADEEKDVGRAPEEPAKKAPQAEPADAYDGGAAADYSEIALVAVAEWRDRLPG